MVLNKVLTKSTSYDVLL